MANDDDLVARIRDVLADEPEISEIKMFGGIAFMAADSMFCGVTKGRVMVRVGADDYDAALARPGAGPMDFAGHGREMRGMVFVVSPGIDDDASLRSWVQQGLTYTRANPTKKTKRKPKAAKTR
jgi:TfoX/Sxy family transcriptional regulator of competence genes